MLVPLTKGFEAIVDDDDFETVSKYKWYAKIEKGVPYATTTIDYKKIKLHHLVMRTDEVIDHINRNTLDNRKTNLRICTTQQNNLNRGPNRANKLGLKGVSYCKRSDRYRAVIKLNGNFKHIGMYKSPEEAAKAYDKHAAELFGEYAYLNFKELNGKRDSE